MDMETAAIIGRQYCAPSTIDLVFTTEAPGQKSDSLAVVDLNGTVRFKALISHSAWRPYIMRTQVMADAHGNPLVTMQQKCRTAHGRWQVFKGHDSDPKKLLFSIKRSSVFQSSTKLEVFLASNTKEEVCDYMIKGEYKGKYKERSSTVYKGNSSMVVAQMGHTKLPLGKDAFGVTISPNTDSCFITALIMILHELHQEEAFCKAASEVGKVVSEALLEIAQNIK